MKLIVMLLAATATLGLAHSASAGTIFAAPASTGKIASPGSYSDQFTAVAGAGLLTFNLEGYGSLDGANNAYTDSFTLSLNGTAIWQGEYDLGGQVGDTTDFIPTGSVITVTSPGLFQGGNVAASIPLALIDGLNTLTFAYSGLAEGVDNEAWGTNSVLVTSSAVPEPASWAMMLVGLGAVGVLTRRRASSRVRKPLAPTS